MFVNRVSQQLLGAPELQIIASKLASGGDATLAVAQSARPLVLASLWTAQPRPVLFVVSGEETAKRCAHALSAWLGRDYVERFPYRTDLPWSDVAPDHAAVAARCRSIERLALGENCIVVASARALMRCVPPQGTSYFSSALFELGDEFAFDEMGETLVSMGYANIEGLEGPGSFCIHGDSVDVWPAQETAPVRLEFFGDEIDRIRRMVASTGQTIAELESIRLVPCRELGLTEATIARARKALYDAAQEDTQLAAELELIEAGSSSPLIDRHLPALYGQTSIPMAHLASQTLVVLAEPRALFDDCQRTADELAGAAATAHQSTQGLFVSPQEMDFGSQQRLSFSTILQAGIQADAALEVRQPQIAGADSKLISRLHQLVSHNYAVAFAVPDRGARANLELNLGDERIVFEESLTNAPENVALADDTSQLVTPLGRGRITFFDSAVPSGCVFPSAHLAVLSVGDLAQRMARHRVRRKMDPTTITFPFKPGDYVVHATHGIALFSDIVRQEVGGRERDYFLLEYAAGDKLYVPLEQVDRMTRYVGADGHAPRLTRLNTADWSRVTGKARASAKKLAFDLVDLYARRAAVTGISFHPDTPAQAEMEAAFAYELTADQEAAIADIKADMESARPMDRLLCGDVGFGKTEVALRAAFKCVADGRQVMVLCPTTILAEQHYQTFFERLSSFEVDVRVLSRFVSTARQRRTIEDFSSGKADILIGTHRLLSADVNPYNLGLVVIDEEQRFGVGHKEQLKNMREQVDVLTLSATPIPRTMQMAVSGVRDMSLIMTPPPGRIPVKVHVGEYDADLVSAAVRTELSRGGQVYYVSNRVTTIDDAVARVLEAVPEARIAVAHGQMSAREAEDVMLRFAAREVDVLVATTIIESGLDNPNTNTLIIEDSQRLGLAQLYQLKGRVGRGRVQAYAYFMFPGEFPLTEEAVDRLTAINEFQDLGSGMRIAMRDLEIRGAGSLVGAEQHGNLSGVGFDLFTQMLGQAVAEARGETGDIEPPELTINLPADFYLAEEYLPEVDRRVLAYRRLAAATELADVNELEHDCEERCGALPEAGRNLFDRARIRIRAARLGISSISLTGGRLLFVGGTYTTQQAARLKERGATVFVKSGKLSYPFHKGEEGLLASCLGLLEELGGDDEDE